jgi:hypothetical protein
LATCSVSIVSSNRFLKYFVYDRHVIRQMRQASTLCSTLALRCVPYCFPRRHHFLEGVRASVRQSFSPFPHLSCTGSSEVDTTHCRRTDRGLRTVRPSCSCRSFCFDGSARPSSGSNPPSTSQEIGNGDQQQSTSHNSGTAYIRRMNCYKHL